MQRVATKGAIHCMCRCVTPPPCSRKPSWMQNGGTIWFVVHLKYCQDLDSVSVEFPALNDMTAVPTTPTSKGMMVSPIPPSKCPMFHDIKTRRHSDHQARGASCCFIKRPYILSFACKCLSLDMFWPHTACISANARSSELGVAWHGPPIFTKGRREKIADRSQ